MPECAPENKSATINDIALAAGVGKATVSLSLNGRGNISATTRRRILEVAQRLNYEPNLQARSLSNGRSESIVLVSAGMFPGVYAGTIACLQNLLYEQGYEVPVHGFQAHHFVEPERQESAMRALRQQRPRAVVCHSVNLHPSALQELERYVREGGILVCYDHPIDLPVDQVIIDSEGMAYQSTVHLLDLGHREIGYFSSGLRLPGDRRLEGFCRALRERDIEVRHDWVFDGPPFETGGVLVAEEFLKLKPRPTGMVIVNDVSAGAFINEIGRAGLSVPSDVSVVGHDDAPCASIWQPRLTTVRHPVEAVAGGVVELLLDRLAGNAAAPRRRVARGELVVRESSGPPR